MKQFMILCFFGLALARPQGYNYILPNHSNSFNEVAHASIGHPSIGQSLIGQSSIGHPSIGQSSIGHTSIGHTSIHHTNINQVPLITKYIYLHAAPEETEEEIKKEINIGQPRVNYKIVFIKAPSYASQAAKLALTQSQVEDKTVIYVLSQKKDLADIQTSIAELPQQINKPEVFFIKYKTKEEALHAQQQIQAQYDALGGKTEVSDEGIAPVSSVIGVLQSQQGGAGLTTGTSSQLSSTSGQATLISGGQSVFNTATPQYNLGHSLVTAGTPTQISNTASQSTYLPPSK